MPAIVSRTKASPSLAVASPDTASQVFTEIAQAEVVTTSCHQPGGTYNTSPGLSVTSVDSTVKEYTMKRDKVPGRT